MEPTRHARTALLASGLSFIVLALSLPAGAAEDAAAAHFRDRVEPVLADHCYGCHADGVNKGGVALDRPADVLLKDRDLWWAVLRNVRSGLMPPAKQPRPPADELRGLDRLDQVRRLRDRPERPRPRPGHPPPPQPGRVPQHRPRPDRRGLPGRGGVPARRHRLRLRHHRRRPHGLPAACWKSTCTPRKRSSAEAVPKVSHVEPVRTFTGAEFRGEGDAKSGKRGNRLSFYDDAKVAPASRSSTRASTASSSSWRSPARSTSTRAAAG